jgi:hypothetical protein
VESVFAQAQALALHSRPVSRAPIGKYLYVLFAVTSQVLVRYFDRFLIWIGSDQEKTFGPTISGLITQHMKPGSYILWDSKAKGGRPDTMSLITKAYAEWNAEGESTVPVTRLNDVAAFRATFDFDFTFSSRLHYV